MPESQTQDEYVAELEWHIERMRQVIAGELEVNSLYEWVLADAKKLVALMEAQHNA